MGPNLLTMQNNNNIKEIQLGLRPQVSLNQKGAGFFNFDHEMAPQD